MSDEKAMVPVVRDELHDRMEPQIQARPVERAELIAQLGTLKLSSEQRKALAKPVDPSIMSIKPTGEPYVSAVFYRRTLNGLFRSWALRPLSDAQLDMRKSDQEGRSVMYREYALIINGVVASVATGEAEYHPSNARMTYGDALESVRSNALTRLCKDIGLFSEAWDPFFLKKWRSQFCVQVWVKDQKKPFWRRLEDEPFLDEQRPTDTSPNREAWFEQVAKRSADRKPETRLEETRPEKPVSGVRQTAQPAGQAAPGTPIVERTKEKVTAVRVVSAKGAPKTVWGVKTTAGEYFFEDEAMYRQIDQLRLQGRAAEYVTENREMAGRSFKWLVEVLA